MSDSHVSVTPAISTQWKSSRWVISSNLFTTLLEFKLRMVGRCRLVVGIQTRLWDLL